MFRFYKSCICCLLLLLSLPMAAQVNIQSGSAVFSLPMFQWQDDRSRLTTAVSLSYSSGTGLKVNDIPSNAGQGWTIMAGGIISRIQAGEPDDQKPRDGGIHDINKYPAGYLYNNQDMSAGCPKAMARYPIFGTSNIVYKQHNSVAADRELDFFSFQFGSVGGVFVLNKYTNTGETLGESKMKIWFEKNENMSYAGKGIRTTISAFYIQDDNGLIYKFSQLGLNKIMRTKYCDPGLHAYQDQPELKEDNVYHEAGFDDNTMVNPFVVNSWSLTKIEDALTHREIIFNYNVKTVAGEAGADISFYAGRRYSVISHKTAYNVRQDLASVVLPDNHQVIFNYGAARLDLIGEKALASIDIKYQNRILSEYLLKTTYMIGKRYGRPGTAAERSQARLCLRSVQKIGPDLKADEPPYVFDYFMGGSAADDRVPARYSHLKDVWGYYNGNYSVGSDETPIPVEKSLDELNHVQVRGLCFVNERNDPAIRINPKPLYARNGLMKMITYPTGGFLTYMYEQNGATVNGNTMTIGGVHVKQTSTVDGGYSNNCDSPLVVNYNYVTAAGSPSLWGVEYPRNKMTTLNHYIPEGRHVHIKWGLIPTPECTHSYQYPGILSQDQASNISPSDLVKMIQVILAASDVYFDAQTIAHLIADPVGGAIEVLIKWAISIVSTCFGDPSQLNPSDVYLNSDLTGVNPLPAQYKRIEVVQGNGGIGKTVSEFTSDDDYPIWSASNDNLSSRQRFASWVYGLPKIVTQFDQAGNKVKELIYRYDTSEIQKEVFPAYDSTILTYNFRRQLESADEESAAATELQPAAPPVNSPQLSCKCFVKTSTSQNDPDWSNPNMNTTTGFQQTSDDNMAVEFYGMYKGRLPLRETWDRSFKPGQSLEYLETKTRYNYSVANFQVNEIVTTQSNGDVNTKTIRYNTDFSVGTPLLTMQAQHILSVPVTVTESVTKAGSSLAGGLVKTVTEFTQLPGGDIRPSRTLVARTNTPQTGSNWALYYGPGNTYNSPDFIETQKFTYDASANLVGLSDEGGHTVTNVYGYDDKYVVSSVINADKTADQPSYTSFESSPYGGWTVSGNASVLSATAVTGQYLFVLSSRGSGPNPVPNSLTASVNQAKSYLLSFWASDALQVSASAVLRKSTPTINGFTYYEYLVAEGNSSITISGNAQLDELRLYPSNSRMRTVTYDPAIGKTSECDENNRVRYYEYDGLGRLQFIKDEYRNIIRSYEYNYLDRKQNGCAGIYYNAATTVYFTKTCSAGYLGTQVPYTIAAGKYSSANSQEDADQLVENEINVYGQAAADANPAGACRLIYLNAPISLPFTKNDCGIGYRGNTVTYTVAAGQYSSVISQSYVDSLAMSELRSNGQVFANGSPSAACVIDTTPYLVYTGMGRCKTGSYGYTGMRQIEVIDINPNTNGRLGAYNTHQWIDSAFNSTICPVNKTPAWTTTGNLRCQQGSGYNTGHREAEEQDTNPSSDSYQQYRWVDQGQNLSACPVTADWQNQGAASCQTSGGIYNTGHQVITQKDMNPYSATYNTTRIYDLGINTTACPITPDWVNNGTYRCVISGGYATGNQEAQQVDQNPNSPSYNQTQWVSAGYNTTACPVPQDWQNATTSIFGQPAQKCETGTGGYLTGHQLQLQQNKNPYSADPNATRYIDLGVNGACPVTADWQNQGTASCQTTGGRYNTGHQVITQKDMNPYSATYNTTRIYDLGINTTACPITPDWVNNGTYRCVTSGGYATGNQEAQQVDQNPNSPSYNQTQWVSAGYNTTACPVPQDWQNATTSIFGQPAQKCETGTGGYLTGHQLQLQQNKNPYSADPNATRYIDLGVNGACPVTADWQNQGTASCQTTGGRYNTGHQVITQKDMNPYSATYNTTRIYDLGINTTACPITPDWVNNGTYRCVTSGGYYTGYQDAQQTDQNPNSPSYGQTQWVNGGYNPSACPVSPPDWRNTSSSLYGQPVQKCETGTGGYNTGHMLQLQVDVNPYSPSYNSTRYVDAGVSGSCPVTADWQNQNSASCQVSGGYNTGHQVVTQKDMNPYSSTYNTTRIFDLGSNPGACPITADWQNQNAVSCQVSGGYNTGHQVVTQRDMNPYSSTYNTTRVLDLGSNTGACPITPDWVGNGNYRCVVSGAYNTGNREAQQRDQNPYSPSYNQTRWVGYDYNTSACPVPADWQNIDAQSCQTTGGRYNTGHLVVTQRDMNPYSSTYNTTRIYDLGVNTSACPITPDWVNNGTYRCVTSGGYYTGYQDAQQTDQNPNSPSYGQTQWVNAGYNPGACPVSPPDWRNATSSMYGQPVQRCETGSGGFNTGHIQQLQVDVNPVSPTYNSTRYIDAGVSGSCPVTASWQQVSTSCETSGGYTDGYRLNVMQDMNPYSGSYGQQTTNRVYDPSGCPDARPNWQFYYDYCETSGGFYTKYHVYVYHDVNPNSPVIQRPVHQLILRPRRLSFGRILADRESILRARPGRL
jgi:hypothetical protein